MVLEIFYIDTVFGFLDIIHRNFMHLTLVPPPSKKKKKGSVSSSASNSLGHILARVHCCKPMI